MAAQTPQSSSKLLKPRSYSYDVFLSFKGKDTSENFTRRLFAALERVGILTFLDEEVLPGGENIFTAVLNTIRRSRISIVVFSKGYASSGWCLDELVEIVHCKNTKGHVLLPIFYHVNSLDIQKQTGTFWEAFTRQEEQFRMTEMKRVQRWRAALTEAAHASGWVLEDDANGSKEIYKIVQEVLDLMKVPRHSKSMDSCVKMIKDLLNLGTSDIRIVGMSWMDGIVKTTLAEVVYNEICDEFEGSSFILNIREISRDPNGLVHLQKQLLYDILKMKNSSINNVDEGINLIEETIQGKRVLIVLDCVDDLYQLNALVGNSICFGPGSRVIATSRDEQLLTELEAHGKYEVQGLHYWNSLKLFSWRASMMGHDHKVKFNPKVNVYNYKQLDMAGEGSEEQITSEAEAVVFGVEAVEITSRFNVLQILNLSRTSIKSLPESIVRLVNLKTLILSYCHQFRTLSPKVGELKQLEVLDLEGTGIKDLSENLRCPMLLKLFLHNNYQLKNIPPLFFNYMPALQILNLSKTSISSLPKSIVNLASLKRLILSWCHDFRELSPEVRELKQLEVLDLEGTEIRHLPENPRGPVPLKLLLHNNNELRKIPPPFFSYMTALQILNLSRSSIWSLPESIVKLVSLKRLILSYCHNFIELSPEVGELKQLEVLDLEGTEILDLPENLRCPVLLKLFLHNNNELGKIPPSFFSYMPALQILNLSRTGIWSLPKSIVKLVSLKRLILSYCHDFTELSPEVGELKQLEVLDLEGTEIRDLPENLRCPMLLELFLHNNNELGKIPPSFFNYMPALQILNLSRTGIWSLPESFVKLVSLKRLILSYCHDFIELSPEVGELKQLEVLNLEGTEIRDLPENLRCPMLLELFLHNNNELRNIPPSFFRYMPALQILNLSRTGIRSLPKSIVKLYSLKRLILSYCHDFMELSPEVGELKQLEVLDLEGTGIRDLPENLRCPMLLELFLHNNSELRKIPPSFFRHMPALQILNLSWTGIKSLPKSIVKLFNLKRLILSYCHDFMELSPEVGELKQLEILDLEGTKIRDLPENLRCPMLLELFLHNNNELRKIPPLFFSYMPILEILNLSMTGISSLPESIVKLASLKRLILSCCHDFIELSPEVGELKQLEVFDLEGTEIMDLPKNPRWLMLLALFLQRNEKLRTIPSSFFDYMTSLQTLNLSRTGIRSLPESVVRLVSLKRLFLSYCHRFMRLSPKVGELKQLEVLDLEGTNIMDLPKEIMKLTNLTCLKFSIYGYMGNGSSAMQSDAPVPRNVISTLSHLEEVNINVNPDDKQWNEMVKDIIVTEVCTLANLNTLHFYFPRVDLVENFILNSPMWKHPSRSHFRFTVGHHVKRIMPRLPREAEDELEKWVRCLKYINGVAVPKEIKKVLQYSTAFFLERHASVKKLSDFGIGNMEQLKCCVVGECNEVEVIMDEADADDHEEDVLGSLEYLCIYYMKNLRSIWKGPVETTCLSLLKYLTLRTCPQLTTIFTKGLLDNLCNLEDLTVDDCPSIKTIVSCETSAEHETSHFLPNLKRMSLHYVPELISISSGLHVAPRLEWLSFYNCPNLKHLLIEEVSSKDLKKIKGEWNWWVALKWRSGRPSYLDEIFVPIDL